MLTHEYSFFFILKGTMSLSPTTELEAVNIMLSVIGEQPVLNINDLAGLQDASIARDILRNVSRSVQSKGWIFNTDKKVTLNPDSNGIISLQANVLRIDSTSLVRNATVDVVERGRKLYDRQSNSFIFLNPVEVDVVSFLDFESLPEPAKRFITLRASRMFHDRVVGSSTLHAFYADDEQMAWQELQEYEGEMSDYNIFDSYDTYRVIDRNVITSIL